MDSTKAFYTTQVVASVQHTEDNIIFSVNLPLGFVHKTAKKMQLYRVVDEEVINFYLQLFNFTLLDIHCRCE